MNSTILAAQRFTPTHVDGGVVGEDTEPTNQWTLINNQHILLIMNEYHPVATLIAVQFWYGKQSVLTKGERSIQKKPADLESYLLYIFLFFSCLFFNTVSNNVQKKTFY